MRPLIGAETKTGIAIDRDARPKPVCFTVSVVVSLLSREREQTRIVYLTGTRPPSMGSRPEVGIRSRLACRSACERDALVRRSSLERPLPEWELRGR